MTTSEDRASLTALLDPSGQSLGFLIPVFVIPGRNALLGQLIDDTGVVLGFEPIQDQDSELMITPPAEVAVGDRSFWAFALGAKVIVGNDSSARQQLETLLDGPDIQSRPMLAMELAEFLKRPTSRDAFAAKAFAQLSEASPISARGWRDLSVLTSDVRNILAEASDRRSLWIQDIVLELADNSVVVHGCDEGTGMRAKAVLRAVEMATDSMPLLYKRPKGGGVSGSPTVEQITYPMRL